MNIPESWIPLVQVFQQKVIFDQDVNAMPQVTVTHICQKYGELKIYYQGGNSITDAYASLISSLSHRIDKDTGEIC